MHIRFDSDEELDDAPAGAQPAAAPAALQPAAAGPSSSCVFASPACTARVDFNLDDPTYVFQTSVCPDHEAVAASASNNRIKTYSLRTAQLTYVGELQGHSSTITQISHPHKDCPYALYSSSRDGTARAWDLRSGQEVESYRSPSSKELFSFALHQHLLAVGGQGEVLFFDTRTRKQLGSFTDTHMDDVTQVKIHGESQHLISASEDGLVAVHSIASALDEDEGFQAALNITNSVEAVGLWGASNELLWCQTGTQALHLWEWRKATTEDEQGGDVCFFELPAARETAAASASSSSAAAVLQEVDYLAGCHYDTSSSQLLLAAGNNSGTLAFFPLPPPPPTPCTTTPPPPITIAPPVLALHGTHSDVVRCWSCLHKADVGPMFITGGEDAKVCTWLLQGAGTQPAKPMSSGSGSKGADRPSGAKHRRTPY